MNETKFKTLMYLGMYVDVNLLEKGIYSCQTPYLYNMDETIETMIAKAENVKNYFSDSYFENLKQCKMVQVFVTEAYVPENSV